MASAEQTTLAILAGGQGSRMGRPKALLQIKSQPVLTYLLNRFAWNGPRWLITAPGTEHPPGFEAFDRELIDPQPNLGPMRGILTALEYLQTPALIVATVDMPAIEQRQLEILNDALEAEPRFNGIMFSRTNGTESVIEPFPLALRRSAIETVRDSLESGRRSVHGMLASPTFTTLPAPADWNVWANLNSPAEFRQFVNSQSP